MPSFQIYWVKENIVTLSGTLGILYKGIFEVWGPVLHLILGKMGGKEPTVTENLFSFDSEKAALH